MFGRMPRMFFWYKAVLVTVFFGIIFLVIPKPVHADPHALFYTAIGQRQLFFNVLAALDQADYVEPALGPLEISRQGRLEKRDSASANPDISLDQAVAETKTNLSALLTRSITLEGEDLWTNYMAYQIARETAQRTGNDELLRRYCEEAFGQKNCEFLSSPKAEADRKRAFVVDPRERSTVANRSAVEGTLGSNAEPNSPYQQRLRTLERDKDTNVAADYPVPYNESLAAAHATVKGNPIKEIALERLKVRGGNIMRTENVNAAQVFDEITDEGALTKVTDEEGSARAGRYTDTLDSLTGLTGRFFEVAIGAGDISEQHQKETTTEGAIADVEATTPRLSANGAYLGRDILVKAPAYSKRDLGSQTLNAITAVETNPLAVPIVGEQTTGRQPIVDRSPPAPAGDVEGATTAQESNGRVLHGTTKLPTDDIIHHQSRGSSLPLDVNPRSFHHEAGAEHLLTAIGANRDQEGCGCDDFSAMMNDFGQAILLKITSRAS